MNFKNVKSVEPLVSVIMITYNQEKYIEEAVKSVVKQKTRYNYEVLVADDASTDNTSAIIEKLKIEYPGKIIYLRREKNLGLQSNFIDAYKRAKGKYVAICEGDDFWCSKHKLERQVDFLESRPDYSVCFHRVINYYSNNNSKSFSNPNQKKSLTLEELAKGNVITNLSVMYRKLGSDKLPGWLYDVKLFDYGMHSIHASYGKIGFLNYPMAVYRRHSKGIWSGDLENGWKLAMDVREKLIDQFFESRMEVALNFFYAYRNIAISLAAYQIGKGKIDDYKSTIARLKGINNKYIDKVSFEDLEKMVNEKRSALKRETDLKSILKKYISKIRVNISKLIPLPHI